MEMSESQWVQNSEIPRKLQAGDKRVVLNAERLDELSKCLCKREEGQRTEP